jgi:hypothetical protein
MAVTPKKMGLAVATTSDATVYTAAAAEVLTSIYLTNTTASPVTVSCSVVPSAGSVSDGNRLFKNIEVPAAGLIQLGDLQIVLATGDFISIVASAATSVTFRGAGVTL